MFTTGQIVYAFFKKHDNGVWGPHECIFFKEMSSGKLNLKYKVTTSVAPKSVVVCANMVFAEKPENSEAKAIIVKLNNHTGSDKNECLKLLKL
jgi:hypothetical protein